MVEHVEPIQHVITILTVLIPTIGGAIASRFIVNSWQEKKEKFNLKVVKFKIKRGILKDLENSYMSYYLSLEHVGIKISKLGKKDFSFSDEAESTSLPETELPQMKFKHEYQAMEKKIDEVSRENCWKFFSTWGVYFDDKKMSETMNKLAKMSSSVHAAVRLMFDADNFESFKAFKEKFEMDGQKMKDLLRDARDLIVTTKMREFPD